MGLDESAGGLTTGLGCALLIPLAIAGVALVNTGLGRARSAAFAMTAAFCAIGTAMVVYFCWGWALQGTAGGPSLGVTVAGRIWSVAGGGALFLRGIEQWSPRDGLGAVLGMFSVGLAATIPLGAASDRWRLSAVCLSSALLAGVTYPLFAHAALAGWLAQLGVNYGLGRGFIDGGSGTVQAVGGLTALAMAWVLGPRRGKYNARGRAVAIPGHDAVLVLAGCFLAWIGWMGLNGAAAVLYGGAAERAMPLVLLNTTLSAASAGLGAALVTRIRFGRPDASLLANGWMCGLVASGAGCALLAPAEAAATGLAAGALAIFAVEFLEARLLVDDPAGAIAVHAGGGLWGLLAVGVLGAAARAQDQWMAQAVGVAALVGGVLPLSYGLNALLDRMHRQRAPEAAEMQGLDLYELGAGAYPEFVIHSEDAGRGLR